MRCSHWTGRLMAVVLVCWMASAIRVVYRLRLLSLLLRLLMIVMADMMMMTMAMMVVMLLMR